MKPKYLLQGICFSLMIMGMVSLAFDILGPPLSFVVWVIGLLWGVASVVPLRDFLK